MTALARLGILATCALLVSSCAQPSLYKRVEPRARAIGGVYTVQPGLAWSSLGSGKLETWTIDGVALERLRFFTDIADGQSLLGSGAPNDLRPRLRTSLTTPEIVEFVADSLFGNHFTPRHVRPVPFGNATGFRFEGRYAASDRVVRDVLVAGALFQGRLHLIVYDGTALHHFGLYRDEVDRIIASVRMTGTPPRPPV